MLLLVFSCTDIAFFESFFDDVVCALAVKLEQAVLLVLHDHGHPLPVGAEFYPLEQLEVQVAIVDPLWYLFSSRGLLVGVGLQRCQRVGVRHVVDQFVLPRHLQAVVSAFGVLKAVVLRELQQSNFVRRRSLIPQHCHLVAIIQFCLFLFGYAFMRGCNALQKLCNQVLLAIEDQ